MTEHATEKTGPKFGAWYVIPRSAAIASWVLCHIRTPSDNQLLTPLLQARCLALVPLAMGVAAVEEYSETFDEDWTDSMELLEFWPEGLEVDEWVDDSSDELFENDDYIDKYVNIGEGNQRREIALVPAVRDRDNIPSKFSRNAIRTSPRTDLVLRGDLTKRCPICPLIVIFLSALSTVARVVKIARTAIQIAKGFNNVARRTKRASTRKISESKNWRNCLAGRDPQK